MMATDDYPYYPTGLQIFFIYDVGYCRHESDDPKDAIIYFNPPYVAESQRCGLCCQLMGTVQFFSSCFAAPKMISMQKGKFAVKQENSYVMVLGGSKDMPDTVLLRQMNSLHGLFRFYHKSIGSIEKVCENRKKFLEKMKDTWDCCLRQSQHDGNALALTFFSVPRIALSHNAKSVMKSSLELLHTCQRKPGVIAGSILYKNNVLTTQLSAILTHRLMMIHPFQRDKFVPETAEVDGRLPPGIRLFNVYLVPEEMEKLASLNKHYPTHRKLSGGSLRGKSKKKIDLRNFFSDAQSSDELSTVTEESVDTVNSKSQSVSPLSPMSDHDRGNDSTQSETTHDEDDSGQSGKSEDCISDSFSDNALSMLKDVAKKSFLSSDSKLKRNCSSDASRERFSFSRRGMRKSKSFSDSKVILETSKRLEESVEDDFRKYKTENKRPETLSLNNHGWKSDIQSEEQNAQSAKKREMRRSRSELTISITYRRKDHEPINGSSLKPEIMSEDSSYYSNEPSPTLGRKQWKDEEDLTASENKTNWQELVQSALQAYDSSEGALTDVRKPDPPAKPPFRRKLSTVMGPQIQKLKTYPKSLVFNYSERKRDDEKDDARVITGNKISDKVSWSSSGYETTTPSYETDLEFKNIAQELSNTQMLPNGKIVPVELRLMPATLKKQAELLSDIKSDACAAESGQRDVAYGDKQGVTNCDAGCDDYARDVDTNVKRLTLYVQSHSEIVLVLLLRNQAVNETSVHSLWRTGLSCLGDLSVEAYRSVENLPKRECGNSHKYLRFNSENHTLSGDSLPLNLKDSSDKMLSRVTQLMHEEFIANDGIADLTIALRDTMIHGHSGEHKETYYQQRRMMDMPVDSPSKSSSAKASRSSKRLESNFGSFLL